MVNIMDKKSIDEFFESLSDEELKEKFDKYERPENMSKYRFKTKEGSFNYTGDKVMEVSDCGWSWRTRVVFGTKNGVYLAWSSAESLDKANEVSAVVEWKFAREVI